MNVYESIVEGLQEAISYESGSGNARTVKCTDISCTRLSCKVILDEAKQSIDTLKSTIWPDLDDPH